MNWDCGTPKSQSNAFDLSGIVATKTPAKKKPGPKKQPKTIRLAGSLTTPTNAYFEIGKSDWNKTARIRRAAI